MTEKLLDISKTAKELNLINKKNGKPLTATLRFWEKQFKDVKPIKLNGNRRYYDKNQLEKLKLIKFLLKDEGLTIKGAKNIIKSRTYALDDSPSSSIKNKFLRKKLKLKANKILSKIKNIKNG
tara:strand:- start:1286 stop:1654 length:369 start_codon:yes stop_codon:yes gene_type:complete